MTRMTRYVPVAAAVQAARQMTDHQLRDAVFCGSPTWALAAIALGRRTPPDLAGRQSAYCIPHTLPWHRLAARRRESRLRALLTRAERVASSSFKE